LSGSALILDRDKLGSQNPVRLPFAFVLFATTLLFVGSAIYALQALVATRQWDWSMPDQLPRDPSEELEVQLSMRAAHLLEDFGGNWEISDLMNRTVDLALKFLLAALVGIAVLVGLLIWYVAYVNAHPIPS
jgi:hypothetical protein